MSKLKPYLQKGVMIAVGAAFKFYSGLEEKRAPEWVVKAHLEFYTASYAILKTNETLCLDCGNPSRIAL